MPATATAGTSAPWGCRSRWSASAPLIVQAGLVGPVVKALGERRALMFGLAGGVAGFMVFGLAETGLVFCLGIPLLSLWGIANPAISSLMTRHVAASEQGQLQGANSSIQGIANLAGPFVFALTFAWSIGGGKDAHLPARRSSWRRCWSARLRSRGTRRACAINRLTGLPVNPQIRTAAALAGSVLANPVMKRPP